MVASSAGEGLAPSAVLVLHTQELCFRLDCHRFLGYTFRHLLHQLTASGVSDCLPGSPTRAIPCTGMTLSSFSRIGLQPLLGPRRRCGSAQSLPHFSLPLLGSPRSVRAWPVRAPRNRRRRVGQSTSQRPRPTTGDPAVARQGTARTCFGAPLHENHGTVGSTPASSLRPVPSTEDAICMMARGCSRSPNAKNASTSRTSAVVSSLPVASTTGHRGKSTTERANSLRGPPTRSRLLTAGDTPRVELPSWLRPIRRQHPMARPARTRTSPYARFHPSSPRDPVQGFSRSSRRTGSPANAATTAEPGSHPGRAARWGKNVFVASQIDLPWLVLPSGFPHRAPRPSWLAVAMRSPSGAIATEQAPRWPARRIDVATSQRTDLDPTVAPSCRLRPAVPSPSGEPSSDLGEVIGALPYPRQVCERPERGHPCIAF